MLIFTPQKYFPQCHASTLAQLKDGRIFAAWFAGTRESYPDTAIWISHLLPDQKIWSEPFVVAKICDTADYDPVLDTEVHHGIAHWNPVLFPFKDKMYLFFKVGNTIENWITYYIVFEDEKWSKPKVLIETNALDEKCNRGPVRSKPIVLSNGYWLAPSSVERTINPSTMFNRGDVIWKAFVDISKNEGKTWNKSSLIDFNRKKYGSEQNLISSGNLNKKYGGVIQPTLWESTPGNVHMLLRSTAGFIFRSDSTDYGKTWCNAYPTELPNNNSGIDVTSVNGYLFLVFNPVTGNWAARTPLSLTLSKDNGKTWGKPLNIQEGPGSFSYPSIITLNDNNVGITYSWNRVSISFVKIILKDKNNIV